MARGWRIAALALGLAAPASAQTPQDEVKGFVSAFVAAFNTGDAAVLARDFYAVPGASPAETQAALDRQYAAMRAEEWGKLNLFAAKPCVGDAAHADVEIDFEQQYSYGGQMPPGDQASVLKLVKTAGGWRIASPVGFPAGQLGACPAG